MGKKAIDPATEIYEVAQQEMKAEIEKMRAELAAAREESFAMGVLKKIEYDKAHNEFLEHAVLYNIKKAKEYKKNGLTWKEFCDALGKSVRRVDEVLTDIGPLVEKFSADFADLSGIKFSKIRYLGRSISADSAEISAEGIVVGDDIIHLIPENKDDIEAYIDSLKQAEKKALEEKKEEVKAKDRVIKALHQTISGQEKDLARYVRTAGPNEVPEAEKDQIKGFLDLKGQFDIFAGAMDLTVNFYLYNASEKVRAEYFSNLVYARQRIEQLWENSGRELGFPVMPGADPDDWEPESLNLKEHPADE